MRYSKQNEEILNIVLSSSNHPDARYIYNKVREKIPNISLGTVYRNLNILSDEWKIRKIILDDGNDRFDKTLCDHNHIRCSICGKVVDIKPIINSNELEKIETNTGFKIIDSCFSITGICEDCLKKGSNS